jgi:hypothetical protein
MLISAISIQTQANSFALFACFFCVFMPPSGPTLRPGYQRINFDGARPTRLKP